MYQNYQFQLIDTKVRLFSDRMYQDYKISAIISVRKLSQINCHKGKIIFGQRRCFVSWTKESRMIGQDTMQLWWWKNYPLPKVCDSLKSRQELITSLLAYWSFCSLYNSMDRIETLITMKIMYSTKDSHQLWILGRRREKKITFCVTCNLALLLSAGLMLIRER